MMQDVEVANPTLWRGPYRAAMFDFDGTLSLLREGWSRIMAELGRDEIHAQHLVAPPDAELLPMIEREVLLLSGKPSIFQMERIAEDIRSRGGVAPNPQTLLVEFHRRLFAAVGHRKGAVHQGESWVPLGTHQLLRNLQARGVVLYLASGTRIDHVRLEANLLMVDHFFEDRVYAPAPDSSDFRKADVVNRILQEVGIPGEALLGVGDGYSETVEVKRVGGTAIGIASEEPPRTGCHAMKRQMLLDLGADLIVPHFAMQRELVAWLFGDPQA
ncbi:MAG: HAD family hydrolase [Fimbriiglobus sp.]